MRTFLVVLGILGSLAAGSPAVAEPPVPPVPPLIIGARCAPQRVCLYDALGTPLAEVSGRTDYFQQLDPAARTAVYVRNNRNGEAAYFRHTSGRISCAEPGLTARFPAGDPVLGVLVSGSPECTFDFR